MTIYLYRTGYIRQHHFSLSFYIALIDQLYLGFLELHQIDIFNYFYPFADILFSSPVCKLSDLFGKMNCYQS